jgi:hypothetical protein
MKNGIKYLVAGLVATGLTASASYAVITVNAGAAQNTFLSDSSVNYLSGDLVEIGTFATTPTVGSASLAGFTVFGSTLTDTGGSAGVFSFGQTASDTGFSHDQIYIVAFNNATGVNPTQEGIFYVGDASNSAWKFPATADVPNSTQVDIQDLFVSGSSVSLKPGATIVYGGATVDAVNADNALELAVVPEPSTWMLVGTGLLGLLGLRRRS